MGYALLGGILIGASAVLLMLSNGRIAGISGIVYGIFWSDAGERVWRAIFVLGLLLGTIALLPVEIHTPEALSPGLGTVVLGGFLVGFGTRWANGCTSGHGVCGLARLSRRSALAVGLFLATAVLTVYLLRHGWT
jgi:hypothetical protein